MRSVLIALTLGLTACTEIPVSQGAPTAGAAPVGAVQAYFEGYPTQLFTAAAETCDGPAQTLVQPNKNEVRCESLPDPESAAAIILQYDGTVEDLPTFVISFAGRDTAEGFLVTFDHYIRVPQRNGGVQQLRIDDDEIEDSMVELIEVAGGRPL